MEADIKLLASILPVMKQNVLSFWMRFWFTAKTISPSDMQKYPLYCSWSHYAALISDTGAVLLE